MSIDDSTHFSSRQKTRYVQRIVCRYGAALRKRHPILLHQNAIGLSILAASLGGMIGSGVLYFYGYLPAWLCIVLNAFFAAFTHELEHDLIHNLYFRKQRAVHNMMLALSWMARPSTLSPWVRRKHHLAHHRFSGTEQDLEERTLSNGTRWGALRVLMTCDFMVSTSVMILSQDTWKQRWALLKVGLTGYVPVTVLNWGIWYLFLGFHLSDVVARLLGIPLVHAAPVIEVMKGVDIAVVVLVGPNVLRTFCLHFISSNIHYYGDLKRNDITRQVQVLTPWWLSPIQVFCMNFGGTHAIHHFVVNEPFYIRQLSAPVAHRAMRKIGVRFNDFGTFRRANRWTIDQMEGRATRSAE